MKNELQHSEPLAKFFEPRREEPAMISAPEIEKLLDAHDMLPNDNHPLTPALERRGNFGKLFTTRRTIMTLSTFAAVAVISYFAFFNSTVNPVANHQTNRSHSTDAKPAVPKTSADPRKPEVEKPSHATLTSHDTRGPWSAGNDQIYADLTREELAKLGIMIKQVQDTDVILSYNLDDRDSLEFTKLSEYSIAGIKYKGNSIQGGEFSEPAPAGVSTPKFFPVLMTFSNGNGAAYHTVNGKHDETSIFSHDDAEKDFRDWLAKPGTPGYYAVAYQQTYSFFDDKTGERRDTVHIIIGKNLPQPRFIPLMKLPVGGYSDTVSDALLQLCHYYDGSSSIKPNMQWPKTLHIKIDTMTSQNFLDQLDEADNSSSMQHLRSITVRLNELIPVIVRPHGGSGAPDSSDFIFWYEPSEELFNALPPMQAAAFRHKLAEPPHCMTSPNAVLTQAEITYCITHPQEVQITVQDLTGKTMIIMSQLAHAGDNILDFTTETLPSGMYIVTVHDNDDTLRSQRLWVENANPKDYKVVDASKGLVHPPTFTIFVNNDEPTPHERAIDGPHPGLLMIPTLELDSKSLAHLGITADDSVGSYYKKDSTNSVLILGFLRTGDGMQFHNSYVDSINDVTPQFFTPIFITDGIGYYHQTPGGDSAQEENSLKRINELIPILLRKDSRSDCVSKEDLIFWYKPTPEFLALLPDSARSVAEAIASQNSKNDALVQMHGAIQNATVYPNPSQGKFSVKLTTSARRAITITLRNLLGQQVAPPVQATEIGMSATLSGSTYTMSQSLDCSNVAEGVYLLDISSDQGERYIERVVIAK